jgi:hypothetical protein
MTEMSCEEFAAQSAELALGILDGRERSDALAHLEHCPVCRQELLLMSDLADGLVELTPTAEPPAGFESRVLASLSREAQARSQQAGQAAPGQSPPGQAAPGQSPPGQARPTPLPFGVDAAADRRRRPRPRQRQRQRPRPLTILSAAAVAALFALGGWAVGHSGASHTPSVGGNRVITADFVRGQHDVGDVIATTGAHPWISVAIAAKGETSVICQVWEGKGTTVTIGTFTLNDGYGYWSAAIPKSHKPITGAQLLDAQGHTIATAEFPTQ